MTSSLSHVFKTSYFTRFLSKNVKLNGKILLDVPCRFLRRKVLPPEFKKQYVNKIDSKSLEHYRNSEFAKTVMVDKQKTWEVNPKESTKEIRQLYQELLPHNIDPRYRDRLRERLERREMMLRRRNLHIPEFYVGSVLAVNVADQFAPNQSHRFVGICIERNNEGLWTTFTLRNVIDKTAVEIKYELYNPTLQFIEVLLLEKRLDQNLLYLRDAPLEESRFPFDMTPIPHVTGTLVPINEKKVKLLPPPWKFQWFLHGYQGIDDSMYDYLSPKELDLIQSKLKLVDRYDLMKMYRSRLPIEEQNIAFGDVQLQHQDLIRFHEQRQRELISHRKSKKNKEDIPIRGVV